MEAASKAPSGWIRARAAAAGSRARRRAFNMRAAPLQLVRSLGSFLTAVVVRRCACPADSLVMVPVRHARGLRSELQLLTAARLLAKPETAVVLDAPRSFLARDLRLALTVFVCARCTNYDQHPFDADMQHTRVFFTV